ncbi:hypothetical protein CC1G_07504 [Coprinopsis cinerea okayama7|uniref:Uncharacterized protein n=1 Tax=Coprinopsis cinerea (strain Okayama-7 / 130 / ATCC MYA-4618 / FGSC 9003) TaxID=240176 RepID=A8P132_COPC7|nr:hypothetical protein CC1G_07504 [Coprinopsis cinerea okayama7\|eukprot:XP_001838014.1 hypothetical protein CC1G_07504 [Coprinopsis cinerea okayama7\
MYAPRRSHSRAPSPMPIGPPMPSTTPTYAVPLPSAPMPTGDAMMNAMHTMGTMPGAMGGAGHTLRRPPSQAEFKVEKVARPPSSMANRYSPQNVNANAEVYFDENVYRQKVAALVAAKDRPAFATTGYVFVEPGQVVLFFRSKSGITQSLDFPIDVEYNSPPALDVLVAACRPHQTSDYNGYMDRESLFYPPTLPLTTSLEISNFPILDAVKNALFPNLPTGHYLTAVKDKLEVLLDGGRLERQIAHLRNDGRAATILLTLPVRFQGGAVVVREPISGMQERFVSKTHPSPPGTAARESLEWVAFLANCDYETEIVDKGYRVMMSYGVYVKNFSADGAVRFDSLSIPTDAFFDMLAPVMNMSRGRKIGFYLSHDYGVNPSVVTAQALVPQLKGGDYLLYHAFKMYKLNPELHWAAGEYIWPSERLVEFFSEDIETSPTLKSAPPRIPIPYGGPSIAPGMRPGTVPPPPFPYGSPQQHHQFGQEHDPLRSKVEESGGQLFADAGVTVLTDWNNPASANGAVERVPFISHGELKKFVVNVLMVVYVP